MAGRSQIVRKNQFVPSVRFEDKLKSDEDLRRQRTTALRSKRRAHGSPLDSLSDLATQIQEKRLHQ